MSLFTPIREWKPITFGSSASVASTAVSNPTRVTIPRQSRRLEYLILHLNVTIATPTSTASRDALEGIVKEFRFKASDAGGQNREVIRAGSATLLAYHRRLVGGFGADTQECIGQKAAGTYDLFIPVHFRHPAMSEVIGHRTSLPLSSAFLASDPYFEFDLGTIGDIGLSAGTYTVNFARVNYRYREVPDSIAYIPSELVSNDYTWPSGGGKAVFELPENGWLAGILHEGFTSATARGDILASSGEWKLRFGRSELDAFHQATQAEEDGWWGRQYAPDVAALLAHNDVGIWHRDLFHDSPLGEAMSAGSMLNLYGANKGDRAQLEGTNLSASVTSRITLAKFLASDPAVFLGA